MFDLTEEDLNKALRIIELHSCEFGFWKNMKKIILYLINNKKYKV